MKKLTRKQLLQVTDLISKNMQKLDKSQDWETIRKVRINVAHLLNVIENGYEEHIPFEAVISGCVQNLINVK